MASHASLIRDPFHSDVLVSSVQNQEKIHSGAHAARLLAAILYSEKSVFAPGACYENGLVLEFLVKRIAFLPTFPTVKVLVIKKFYLK